MFSPWPRMFKTVTVSGVTIAGPFYVVTAAVSIIATEVRLTRSGESNIELVSIRPRRSNLAPRRIHFW